MHTQDEEEKNELKCIWRLEEEVVNSFVAIKTRECFSKTVKRMQNKFTTLVEGFLVTAADDCQYNANLIFTATNIILPSYLTVDIRYS